MAIATSIKLTQQSTWLQSYASRVNVLDQLTKDIRLELLHREGVMLVCLRLKILTIKKKLVIKLL